MGLSSGASMLSKNTKLDTDAALLISEWVLRGILQWRQSITIISFSGQLRYICCPTVSFGRRIVLYILCILFTTFSFWPLFNFYFGQPGQLFHNWILHYYYLKGVVSIWNKSFENLFFSTYISIYTVLNYHTFYFFP